MHSPGKKVPIYATPEFGDRCHVHLLDYYLEKLSAEARDKDFFYVRHLEKYTADSPWYSAVPVGKHTLSKIVKEMCDNAGIAGSKTNHSLKSHCGYTNVQRRCSRKAYTRTHRA